MRWLSYIAGPEFIKDWKKNAESGNSLKKLASTAKQIVEEEIYSKNTTPGTGRIKDSMVAVGREGELPGFAVASDPSIAPAKGPIDGSKAGASRFSYAAFFEDPKFNTFIPPEDDETDPRRYRPFFDAMVEANQMIAKQLAMESLMRTIKRRMPRMQGEA